MKSLKVAILRTNPVYADPRVIKEALSLSKAGYNILIIAWDRRFRNVKEKQAPELVISRLRVWAPYGTIVLMAYLPVYWIWALAKLIRWNPNIVHACDLDTAIPAYIYKVIRGKKMIFDMFDSYYLGFPRLQPRYRKITPLIYALERLFAFKADGFITVSRQMIKIFSDGNKKPTAIIMNCPESNEPKRISKCRSKFAIVYAGSIHDSRGLRELVEATKGMQDVQIVLAGRVFSKGLLKDLLKNRNVEYLGLLPYTQSMEIQSSADVIPIFFDPEIPISKVAAPNKLFEAMMLAIPVITNIAEEIVESTGCGIVVNYGNIEQIRRALVLLLKNPTQKKEMGLRGREAYIREYNWSRMEDKLLQIYRNVSGN